MSTYRERAAGYLRDAGGVNLEKWFTYALLGTGAYLLLKTFRAGAAVGSALTNTGSAIGSGLYDAFHKNQAGDLQFYTVRFLDDGKNHSIPASSVDEDGNFKRNGIRYRLLIDSRIKSGVNKVAIRA